MPARVKNVLAPALGLIGGIYLAGLPTYYALFTVGDSNDGAARARHAGVVFFVAWLIVALLVGYLALLKDSELLRVLRPAYRRLRSARQYDALNNAVSLMLRDRRFALLRAFSPKVFVCDDRDSPRELFPFDTDHPADWQRWRVGYGAVGAAFEANRDEVLLFKDENLDRQNRSLSEEQLRRYSSLVLVAACVLRGANERPIGVLSVSSQKNTGFGEARVDLMRLLASELGVLLDLIA